MSKAEVTRLKRRVLTLETELNQLKNGVVISSLPDGSSFIRTGTFPGEYSNLTRTVNGFVSQKQQAGLICELLTTNKCVLVTSHAGDITILPEDIHVIEVKK